MRYPTHHPTRHPMRNPTRHPTCPVARQADVEARTKQGATPLSLAVILGFEGILQQLLDAGAGIEEKGISELTPLGLACRSLR